MLGVSPNTLRNWDEARKLIAHKTLGGHRRYFLSDVKRILESPKNEDIIINKKGKN